MTATEAEVVALNRDLARQLRDRDLKARAPARSEARAPGDGSRRPLGLRPVDAEDPADPASERDLSAYGEPDLDRGPIINLEEYSQEFRDAAATVGMAYFCLNTAASLTESLGQRVKARFAELRSENARLETELARLRAQFAEAKAEFGEAKHILERLQITREGKRGERGPCGADGAPGPRGERGERGERGSPAPAIIEWRPDPEAFSVTAILADGSTGPMIALRSLFEAYHSAVSWIEDADLTEAARASRAQTEAEVEASRRWHP